MLLEFDQAKSAANVAKRGIDFERFADMDLAKAVTIEDTRADYGEPRIMMFGPIDDQLHVAVITFRADRVRVISLRRANRREERQYAKERQPTGRREP